MNKYALALSISSFVVVSDQITKWLIEANFFLYERVAVFSFLDLTYVRNPGAAFGILNTLSDSVRMPLFALVLVMAVAAIFTFLRSAHESHKLLIAALGLVLGGAVGNSIDRFRYGYVVDFIDVHWFGNPDYHWPAFNIADSAITVGVILILFETFFMKREG
ncbi:MAG: signal peptidase II [Deltaproteobacteria bacterium]